MSGPSHGTPVGDSDWNENDHLSPSAARSATAEDVSSSCSSYVAGAFDGEAVRGEDDVRIGPAHPVGEEVDEPRLGPPALDERELRSVAERCFDLAPIARDRER